MDQHGVQRLREELSSIEESLDQDRYRPGPWARFLWAAEALPAEERASLQTDVTRVNDKLHRRNHPGRKASVRLGVFLELLFTLDAIAGIYFGLRWDVPILVGVSTFLLCATLQPLTKMFVGTLLGVRYSYFYLHFILEPRVKMQFGTYLPLSTDRRVLLHFAGMVGSPFAFLVVAPFVRSQMPATAQIFLTIGWGFVGLNLVFFLLGMMGQSHVSKLFSGGAAAKEIRKSMARSAVAQKG